MKTTSTTTPETAAAATTTKTITEETENTLQVSFVVDNSQTSSISYLIEKLEGEKGTAGGRNMAAEKHELVSSIEEENEREPRENTYTINYERKKR